MGVKFFGKSGQQLAATTVDLCADRWDERAVVRRPAQPFVAADEPAPAVGVGARRSGLYDGGEVDNSRGGVSANPLSSAAEEHEEHKEPGTDLSASETPSE